jgi:predicted enzyme related to lactoylglutathione lyase
VRRPVVHLELHTPDAAAARQFYSGLLDWGSERVETEHGSYTALGLGGAVSGGLVECGVERPLWLPYVEVDRIEPVTERARSLGAEVLLEPREGPAGWRSVVGGPHGAQVALWQAKEPR